MTGLMWFPVSSWQKTMGAPHYSFGLFWILDSRQSSVAARCDSLLPVLDASDTLILEEF